MTDSTTNPVSQARSVWKCRFAHEEMQSRINILNKTDHDEVYVFPFKKNVDGKHLGTRKGQAALSPRPTFRRYGGKMPPIFTSLNGLGVAKSEIRALAERGYVLGERDAALMVLRMQYYCPGMCATDYKYIEGNARTQSEPVVWRRGVMEYTNFTDHQHGFGEILRYRYPNEDECNRSNMRGLDPNTQLVMVDTFDVFRARATVDSVKRALGLEKIEDLQKPYYRCKQTQVTQGATARATAAGGYIEPNELAWAYRDLVSVSGLHGIRLFKERLLEVADPAMRDAIKRLFTDQKLHVETLVGLKDIPANQTSAFTLKADALAGIKKTKWPADKIPYPRALQSLVSGVGSGETTDGSSYESKILQKGGAQLFFSKFQEVNSLENETVIGMCSRPSEPRGGQGDITIGGPPVM